MCVLRESVPFSALTGRQLLDVVLPHARGTIAQLNFGANLLFAGCDALAALVELARHFPQSRFFGLEPAAGKLTAAGAPLEASHLQNLRIETAPGSGREPSERHHFAIRLGGETAAPLASLARRLRDGGLLFDLHNDEASATAYGEAGFIVLRAFLLPGGICHVVRKQSAILPLHPFPP